MKRLLVTSLGLLALVAAISRERARPAGDERIERADEASLAAPTPIARPREASAAAPAQSVTKAAPPTIEAFTYPRELERYRTLAAKVFLTEDETRAKRDLLHDARVLKAAGARLRLPVRAGPELAREQDVALALLIEARRAGDAAATEALIGLVTDRQVEDPKLDRDVREQLAGFKAEALFEWSSDAPDDAGKLEAMLPGPVSQRLWQNVRERQSSNLAESSAEKMGDGH